MKHGTIVPEVVSIVGKRKLRYVTDVSANSGGAPAEAFFSCLDGRSGYLDAGKIRVAEVEKVVNKRRGSAPDVDDRGVLCEIGRIDHPQRILEVRSKPANLRWLLRLVNILPVLLSFHNRDREPCGRCGQHTSLNVLPER